MSTDIVISEVPSRTYTVPSAFADDLGDRADLSMVYDSLINDNDQVREWAEKIINGIERERGKQEAAVLASLGYDPESYDYIGLTAAGDDDFIFAVARLDKREVSIEKAEILSQNALWNQISDDLSASTQVSGVAMDASLLAFTASAFTEGCQGVHLAYGEPLAFLDCNPMTTTPLLAAAQSGGHVYAIVDATDTSAVMDVIMIKPGPEVFRRDAGSWILDQTTLDALLSVSPPPLVELEGDLMTSVLEQVDSSQANQLDVDGKGAAQEGAELEDNPIVQTQQVTPGQKPTIDKKPLKQSGGKPSREPSSETYRSNQNKSQLKDGSSARTASLLSRYDDLNSLIAAANGMWPEFDNTVETKRALLAAAHVQREELRLREYQLNNVLIPALTADAQSVHDATPNQRKATHLRKYWVRGKGAVKIRWGTPGDFTRCERQLRKYLGVRAKGYCAKRHKEVMGFWPGDKRNTGPTKGAGKPIAASVSSVE